MTGLVISQSLLWIVIAALTLVVLALARQIGVLHERIAPVGALVTDNGPEVGEATRRFEMPMLEGGTSLIGGALPAGSGEAAPNRLRLLLFVAADCPICKRVAPLARRLAQAEALDLTLVGDGAPPPLLAMRDRLGLADIPFAVGPEIGLSLHIGRLPYAVLLDPDGVIRAKGLVNSREHLESLLVASETGHPTVQSFLARRHEASHAAR